MNAALFFWLLAPRKRVNARLWSIVGSILLIAGAADGCRAEGTNESGEGEHAPTAVRVVQAEERPMRETVETVGTVASRRTLRLTARVPGTLEELPVEEGDRVEKGEVLARIDAPELEAKRERIGAELGRARAEREFACSTFETDRKLHESGALAGSKLDASRKRCTSAKEGVAAARAQLGEIETRLAKRVEHAPLDGTVLDRRAEPGEHVGPGRPLLVLGERGREVVVPVVEGDVARGIAPGTPVQLRVGEGASTETSVRTVDPRAQGPGRAVDVHMPLDGEFDRAPVGGSVDVAFVLDREPEATPVPREALVRTDGTWSIYVVEEGVAHRRAVERGVAEGNWISVHPKLEPDRRVVVTNLDVVRDGTSVYAVEAAGGTQ